jgi:hypothetical protein
LSKNYKGLWLEDANKMRKYITGGYLDEREEFSNHCDIEEYRKLRKNFTTFDQIYTSIKEDKGNPIGKINFPRHDHPNLL